MFLARELFGIIMRHWPLFEDDDGLLRIFVLWSGDTKRGSMNIDRFFFPYHLILIVFIVSYLWQALNTWISQSHHSYKYICSLQSQKFSSSKTNYIVVCPPIVCHFYVGSHGTF
jgi:hypothetical protein